MGDTPPSVASRFFRSCLLILGGVLALWFALELLSHFWGWIVLIGGIALVVCGAVWAYRHWWGG